MSDRLMLTTSFPQRLARPAVLLQVEADDSPETVAVPASADPARLCDLMDRHAAAPRSAAPASDVQLTDAWASGTRWAHRTEAIRGTSRAYLGVIGGDERRVRTYYSSGRSPDSIQSRRSHSPAVRPCPRSTSSSCARRTSTGRCRGRRPSPGGRSRSSSDRSS